MTIDSQFIQMLLVQLFTPVIFTVFSFVLIGYLLSRVLKRNDVADVVWGLGFVMVAIVNATQVHLFEKPRALAIFVAVLAWGLRLALYIGIRNFKKNEDARYANWRKEWGTTEPLRAFLQVFLLQGVILGVISLPITWGIRVPGPSFGWLDWAGLFLFLTGFLFEAIADTQMYLFKKDKKNKGKVMRKGLWALSRHPNYFGEILVWWGIFAICVKVPYGFITIVSPALITFLLVRVSGVTMLEKLMENKNEEYKAYQKEVPALLPRFF